MFFAATVMISSLFQCISGTLRIQKLEPFPPTNIVQNAYIVTLNSDTYRHRGFSNSHAELYFDLRLLGINFTVTNEYRDPILTAVAVQLGNANDLERLSEAVSVRSISPIHYHPLPKHERSIGPKLSKRARDTPWSHIVTGVDKLHQRGYDGEGVKIGIVDTGVDWTHRALGHGFGRTKKIVGGYDFVGNDYTGEADSPPPRPSSDPLDQCHGHGTMVAGVIGAEPGIEPGVKGVAYRASLSAYRVGGCKGAPRDDMLIKGIIRAHQDENDIIVVASYNPGGWGMGVLAQTMDKIASEGRVIVVAAGNSGEFGPWLCTDPGYHQGIISVGSVENHNPQAPIPSGQAMYVTSCYGPTKDMYLAPVISAPGHNIRTTFPVGLGAYITKSCTSVAAPFVAGVVALWLQAKGINSVNAWDARRMIQNTALPMRQNPRAGGLIDTAARQGAGLIHAYNVIYSKATMRPTELLANDTMFGDYTWKIFIRNEGDSPVEYSLTHVPAGTARTKNGIESVLGPVPLVGRYANVQLSHERLQVPPRKSRFFDVVIEPPTGLDVTTFPVYSGYIQAEGSDGSRLQSVYLGLAARLKDMKILDDVSVFRGQRLPVVVNRNGQPIRQATMFTMQGNNVPTLVFRLAAGTSFLSVDLIDARAPMPTGQSGVLEDTPLRSSGTRGSAWSRVLSWGTRRFGRTRLGSNRFGSSRFGSHRSGSSSRLDSIGGGGARELQWRSLGRVLMETHAGRDIQLGTTARTEAPWTFREKRVDKLVDGSDIPDGDYRIFIRALKLNGDARYLRDYELWTSEPILIRRP